MHDQQLLSRSPAGDGEHLERRLLQVVHHNGRGDVQIITSPKEEVNGVLLKKRYSNPDKSEFSSLTKAELQKYVNAPSWTCFRMSLLVLLFVVILGLIGGAIYLVCSKPKCSPDSWEKSWWKRSVIYQITVKSFQDSNNDGTGDLEGVRHRLDYIQSLGVQTILLNPVYMSQSGNNFAVINFTNIDPSVGTLGDFERLIAAVHERNMTLIMDFIPTHTSLEHPWFRLSEANQKDAAPLSEHRFYVWHDGHVDNSVERGGKVIQGFPNKWKNVYDDRPAWTWSETRQQYYLHQYSGSLPDLDYRNAEVATAMENVLLFWLKSGVDGFRFLNIKHLFSSSAKYISASNSSTLLPETLSILKRWRTLTNDPLNSPRTHHKLLVLDELNVDSKQLDLLAVDMVFNGNLLKWDSMTNGLGVANLVGSAITAVRPKSQSLSWALGNYNHHRVASRIGSSDLIDGLNMVNLLLPGASFTFYGDELCLKDSGGTHSRREDLNFLVRGPQLTLMQWSSDSMAGFTNASTPWIPADGFFRASNVQLQQRRAHSHLKTFQQIVALRETPPIRDGSYHSAVVGETIYSFLRRGENGTGYFVALDLRKTGSDPREYSLSSAGLSGLGVIIVGSVNLFRPSERNMLTATNATLNLNGSLVLRPGEAVVIRFSAS